MPVFAVDNLPSFCVSPCPCRLCCECHVTATVTASRQSSGRASIKTFEFPFNLKLTKCGKFNVWIIFSWCLSLVSDSIVNTVLWHPTVCDSSCPLLSRPSHAEGRGGLLLLKLEGWRRREYVKIFFSKYNVSTVSILFSVQVSIQHFTLQTITPIVKLVLRGERRSELFLNMSWNASRVSISFETTNCAQCCCCCCTLGICFAQICSRCCIIHGRET